jgi:hypothetical protein
MHSPAAATQAWRAHPWYDAAATTHHTAVSTTRV